MRLAGGLLVGLVLLVFTAPAGAATINVTTTADQYGTGPACSIREAVQAANTNAAFGGCPTGNGADTVRIPAGTYTITIPPTTGTDPNPNSEGDLVVTSRIAFVGAGPTATKLDGGGLDRLFYISGANPATFSKLTLRHGDPVLPNQAGGAIYTAASVTLTNVRIVDNDSQDGGGIRVVAPGSLLVTNSTLSGNEAGTDVSSRGGAISTLNARLTVRDTTVSGNDGGNTGGGIYTEGGIVTLTRVVVDANQSDGSGGGLYAGKSDVAPTPRLTISQSTFTKNSTGVAGGAITVNDDTDPELVATIDRTLMARNKSGGYVPATPFTGISDGLHNQALLTITNSTITLNGDPAHEGKGGGLLNTQFGVMTLRNVTVTANRASDVDGDGDNLWNQGVLRVKNSIVGGATATGNCGGLPVTSQGHNLEFDVGGDRCFSTGTDRLGNPRLKPLAANGGPTKTLALGPSSAALDRGAACTSADQRGAPRSLGGRCDLGAYERVRCRGAIVNVVGTSGRDIFRLGSRIDAVLGLGGNDAVNGGGGGDRLCGGAGNDRLAGNGGADILDGGPGGDTCVGGPGSDRAYSCRTAREIP